MNEWLECPFLNHLVSPHPEFLDTGQILVNLFSFWASKFIYWKTVNKSPRHERPYKKRRNSSPGNMAAQGWGLRRQDQEPHLEIIGKDFTYGNLYSALKQLTKKKYVVKNREETVQSRRGWQRMYYSLSPDGVKALLRTSEVNAKIWMGVSKLVLKQNTGWEVDFEISKNRWMVPPDFCELFRLVFPYGRFYRGIRGEGPGKRNSTGLDLVLESSFQILSCASLWFYLLEVCYAEKLHKDINKKYHET